MVKSRRNQQKQPDENSEPLETIPTDKIARKKAKIDVQDELSAILEAYSAPDEKINSQLIDVKLKYTTPSKPSPPRPALIQRRLTDILYVGKQSTPVTTKA